MSITPELSADAWREGLHDFIVEKRRTNPLPPQENLSPEEFHQFRVIGGELISWYNNHFQDLYESRVVFEKLQGFDLTPFAVVLTSMPGLVASQLIWGKPQSTLVFVLSDELDEWLARHPDEGFKYHQAHWSYFSSPTEQQCADIARRFPALQPETYRLHESGDLYGPQMGVGGTHLWQWKDDELSLVEEGFEIVRY